MSLFRKLEIGFIAALMLMIAGLTAHAFIQNAALAREKQVSSLQTARADAHSVAIAEITRVISDKETASAQLDAALEANPDYAGAAVPDPVAHLLRHPSGAARAIPE